LILHTQFNTLLVLMHGTFSSTCILRLNTEPCIEQKGEGAAMLRRIATGQQVLPNF